MNFKIVKKYITIDQQILNKMKKREKKQNQRTNNILRLFGEDPIQKTRKQKKWKTPPKKKHTQFSKGPGPRGSSTKILKIVLCLVF